MARNEHTSQKGGYIMTRDELIQTVENYRTTAFRIAYGYTGSFEDSEDITQDVFLKLLKCDKEFKDEEHKKAWIIRVTINAAKSLLRRSWRTKRDAYEMLEDIPYYSDVAERELFDCVMRLPEKYRTVVYLYYYEDYPVQEVAKLTGISKTAVTTRLSRAREQLKKTFEREEIRYERKYQESL
jgi:RNA polymerase sigma-70 factor (ECF subfamily)